MNITITLTAAQEKGLAYVAASPQEWVENAVHNRCRQAIDEIYTAEVARMTADPSITSIPADKDAVVLAADVQTAAQRNAAAEAALGEQIMSKSRDSVEDLRTIDTVTATANAALPKAGGALTGAVTTNSTFDGVDIATRDGVLTSTTATAAAALPKAGGTMTGVIAGFTSTGIDDNATSTAITIDSSERVVIGATVQAAQNAVTISSAGYVQARATGVAGYFDRIGSDGSVLEIRKSGTTVGSIGTNGSRPYLTNPTYGGISVADYRINPVNASGAAWDNALNLGAGGSRWKDLYLSGGVYLGGTGAANKLDDYEEGTWTPTFGGGMTITYPSTTAKYTKVGALVTWNCSIQWSGKSGGSGTLTISMPFAANGTGQWQGNANSSYRHGITVASDSSGYMESNAASCYISLTGINAGNVSVSQMAVGGHLIMGGSYQTT